MTSHRTLRFWAAAAMLFGVLTVFSGGRALFGDAAARASLGKVVDFVLWFNFLAGFVYVLAGWLLWQGQRWGRHLAMGLAASTALVAAAFGVHVLGGGGFEMRTVGALALRLGFWVAVAVLARSVLSPGRSRD
jgi:uncharacterized membrane protein (UPF0136 family)